MDVDFMIDTVYKCKLCCAESNTVEDLRHHVKLSHPHCVVKENSLQHIPVCGTEDSNSKICPKIDVVVEKSEDESDQGSSEVRYSKRGRRIFPTANSSQPRNVVDRKRLKLESEDLEFSEPNEQNCTEIDELHETDTVSQDIPTGYFACAKCQKKYKTKQSLAAHNKSCHRTRKCNQCDASFRLEKELKIHQDTHYENSTFKCLMCDYTNAQYMQVKIHMETHNSPNTHKCPSCKLSFASSLTFKNHWRFQHLGGIHLCDQCGFEAQSKYVLFQHKMKAHPLGYSCQRCSFKCDNAIDMNKHIEVRHKSGFTCKYCSPPTTHALRDQLVVHMDEKHPGKKCFLCDKCNYVAKMRHHLDKHNLMHTGERPMICEFEGCDFRTRDRRNLKQHIVTKHRNPGDLVCRQCHFVTTNQNEWDIHRAMYHMKVFQCDQCPYKTRTSACLRRHRLAKHVDPEKMRYPCPHCSYRANIRESLNKHLLTHVLRSSRHRCAFCRQNFNSREEVYSHLEETHPSESSLVQYCDQCPYSCKSKPALKQHLLIHSDVKSHKCKLCDYSSRTATALRSHNLRKHQQFQNEMISQDDGETHSNSMGNDVLNMESVGAASEAIVNSDTRNTTNDISFMTTLEPMSTPSVTSQDIGGNRDLPSTTAPPKIVSDGNGLSMLSAAICADAHNEKQMILLASRNSTTHFQQSIIPQVHTVYQAGNSVPQHTGITIINTHNATPAAPLLNQNNSLQQSTATVLYKFPPISLPRSNMNQTKEPPPQPTYFL